MQSNSSSRTEIPRSLGSTARGAVRQGRGLSAEPFCSSRRLHRELAVVHGQDVARHGEELHGRAEREARLAVEPQPPEQLEDHGLAREDPDGPLMLASAREERHRLLAVRVQCVPLAQGGREHDVCVFFQRVREHAVVVAGHEEERRPLLSRAPALPRLEVVDAHEHRGIRDVGHRDDLGVLDREQRSPLREGVLPGLQQSLCDLQQPRVVLQLLVRPSGRRREALECGIGLLGVVCGSSHGCPP